MIYDSHSTSVKFIDKEYNLTVVINFFDNNLIPNYDKVYKNNKFCDDFLILQENT